jgi:hypothetical protein
MICDRCYQRVLSNGGEHGVGLCPFEKRRESFGRGADVTWPGGKVFENLSDQPQTFYSPRELNQYLKAHNLEPFVRHTPVPGSDKSPHTVSWAAVSQETLDGAKAMLERVGTAAKEPVPQTYIQSMTVTMTDEAGYVTTPIAGLHAR